MAQIARLTASPVTVPNDLSSLDAELMAEAEVHLGYVGGSMALGAQRQSAKDAKDLHETYQKVINAGIRPLDPVAVRKYMRREVAKKWAVPILLTALIVLIEVGLGVKGPGWAGLVGVFPAIFLAVWIWAVTAPIGWGWSSSLLHGYERPIPSHVLSTALLVSKELGLSSFSRRGCPSGPGAAEGE